MKDVKQFVITLHTLVHLASMPVRQHHRMLYGAIKSAKSYSEQRMRCHVASNAA